MLQALLLLLSILLIGPFLIRRCRQALHLLQLDSYANLRLLKWLWREPLARMFELKSALLTGVLALISCFPITRNSDTWFPTILLLSWLIFGTALFMKSKPAEAKKPLVLTGRALRLLLVSSCLSVLLFVEAFTLAVSIDEEMDLNQVHLAFFFAAFVSTQLSPFTVIIANILLYPLQYAINQSFLIRAQRKLKRINPIVIGVTGSYGKTSTKYFIETLLSERYAVLKTPGSFNTLLGISRVINESLKEHHKVFIVEIGAYQRGDVKEKCDFVRPKIGVLTTIGPEHVERFLTMENIIATNYELIESLGSDDVAVMNNDNEFTAPLIEKTTIPKVLRFGLNNSPPPLTFTAREITSGTQGLKFTLVSESGESVSVRTKLLGRHNVTNILAAAAVAQELGLNLKEIARGIEKLEAAPHRLKLLPRGGGVLVIDDSYNSNPTGAAEALDALSNFNTGRRILVTPGMVELGELEVEKNREFGAQAARSCDLVILVGPKQTAPIFQGLKDANFSDEKISIVKDLNEARVKLDSYLKSGDVVLFENDLPDQYAER